MRQKFPHLITGVVLLAAAAYFLLPAVHGWKPLPSRPAAAHREIQPSQEATAADPALADAAKIEVYGVLGDSAKTSGAETSSPTTAAAFHSSMDHIVDASADASARFLHRRFSLRGYQGFGFIVLTAAVRPRLQGTFKSSAGGGSADIEILLLNQQEFDELVHGEGGTATFSTVPSNGGEVNWALSSSMSGSQTYYLVFHNPSSRSRAKVVDADFSLNFD